jgi:hypothetical protein
MQFHAHGSQTLLLLPSVNTFLNALFIRGNPSPSLSWQLQIPRLCLQAVILQINNYLTILLCPSTLHVQSAAI